MGKKHSDVKPNEAQVLEELEKSIGKTIKRRKKIAWDENGYTVEENSVLELNLNSADLKTLPASIGQLESLQAIFLNNNRLTTLPESFCNLKSLQHIALGENKLKALPEAFGNLIYLKELWINNNRLTALPNSLTQLKSLQELNLEHNRLDALPDSFGNLKSLKMLDLSHNQLTTIPESFGKIKPLETLDLEHNKLEWLPEPIGNLKALQKMDISHNQLTMLPGSIGNLKSIQTLDLQRNQLKVLPGTLWRLQNLHDLRIAGNPLEREWSTIKKKGTQTILEFCRQIGSINIFISYAVGDYDSGKYPLSELADNLKTRDEINYAYHCMQDMKKVGQFDKFMNENLPKCQILLFIATNKSLQSKDCQHELQLAKTHGIKVIPILGNDVTWEDPAMEKAKLTRELGLKFKGLELKQLCNEIYDYIRQYKRKHEVFTREEATLRGELLNIKHTLSNFLESAEFEKILKDKLPQFTDLFQALNTGKISQREYFLKCSELLPKKK